MRIENLHILGFGGLEDLRIDFSERITVIVGENESGKSTLHRAIRAALYGIDAGGQGRAVERSDWQRWQPWRGSKYGVAMTYRLDSGKRIRVSQNFEKRESQVQVQALGGGDLTAKARNGRTVSPGRLHLGMDEAVFCAAPWLGEEGLRIAAPDSAAQRSERIQEAVERLADSGKGGITCQQAIALLRDALKRVGSERQASSPMGHALQQLHTIDAALADARRRQEVFTTEQMRLGELQEIAHAASVMAREAEIAWLAGRLSSLANQESELSIAESEMQRLQAEMEKNSVYADFPLEDEDRVNSLGGEFIQAERAANETEAWCRAAQDELQKIQRRRREIAAGINAFARTPLIDAAAMQRVDELRQNLGAARTLVQAEENADAGRVRAEALQREIAASGFGRIPSPGIPELVQLLDESVVSDSLWQKLSPFAGTGVVLAAAASAVLMLLQQRMLSAASFVTAVLCLAVILLAKRSESNGNTRLHRRLARYLPGAVLDVQLIEELRAELPRLLRLHGELEKETTLLELRRQEIEKLRGALFEDVKACLALANGLGFKDLPVIEPGLPAANLAAMCADVLQLIADAASRSDRKRELDGEDKLLSEKEQVILQQQNDLRKKQETLKAIENRLRQLMGGSGVNVSLPPAAAIAAFRHGCAARRQYDRSETALAELQRRLALVGGDPAQIQHHREELMQELARRGGDAALIENAAPLNAAQLRALEREAQAASRRAAQAEQQADALNNRLQGATSGLPNIADLEDERQLCVAALERARHQAASLKQAISLIELASENVHRELAPRLAASMRERLALLTGERYTDVNVDTTHFGVSLLGEERPDFVALDVASHGTRDQVSLLLRLALCEVLSEGGEAVPLFLDEPFLAADLGRRHSLMEFLTALAAKNQVLVTTSDPLAANELCSLCPPGTASSVVLQERELKALRQDSRDYAGR